VFYCLTAYAVKNGYELHIFAPGYPESEVCNPLEFLKDDTDSMMARQFAEVMNQNFKRSGQTSEDGFFGPAGDQVTEAIMMLARGTEYPDLMMCQALASRTDLAHQIIKQKEQLNPWVLASFGQLISSAESEKTVSSILATAIARFKIGDVLLTVGIGEIVF
jgi:type IV secretory pathway TraG/TraD family ATPase VirD4